jgi:hypothetical protein
LFYPEGLEWIDALTEAMIYKRALQSIAHPSQGFMTESDQARSPGFADPGRLPRPFNTAQWLCWAGRFVGITVAGQQRFFTAFPFSDLIMFGYVICGSI